MNLTKNQTQAVYKEGSNIIVSAGAGSGKTAVLSERVLRKLKDGIDIRKILVLTFTNEAAGEMKNRIRDKIKKNGLKDNLEYLDSAYITTFDAYAFSIVKKYHYLINLNRNVNIIDSSIIDLEKNRILEEIFLELYQKKDACFLKLIDDFTSRDDEGIKKAILSIKNALDLKYDKNEYLNNYLTNFYNDNYFEEIFKEYFLYLKNLCEEIENNLSILEDKVDSDKYIKIYDGYSKLIKPVTYNDLYKIKEIKVTIRGLDEEGKDLYQNLKDLAKDILDLTKYSKDELKEFYWQTKDYVKIIIDIILELDKRLDEYKYQKGAFEFNDIAKMAIKIVKDNPLVNKEIKDTYNEILIDEYQDTSDLQEMFINSIENNNVYMVGDIKQSIYRFRNANPNIFKNKYDKYKDNKGGIVIDLLENFRSRKEVLDNINEIFNLVMTKDIGSVDYQDNQAMVFGNLAYEDKGYINSSRKMDILEYSDDNKEFTNAEVEAFIIAQDIKNKVLNSYQVYDFELEKTRESLYSDFCIILDRGRDMALYKKIFEYFNIPLEVYNDADLTIENDILIIKNFIGLILKIYDKEFDNEFRYYMVSVARSFICELGDNEILDILNEDKIFKTNIYKKCLDIANDLNNLTPEMLIKNIIKTFDFYEALIKVGDVNLAIERIQYILDLAHNSEDLGFTIRDFKEYLEEAIKSDNTIKYRGAKSSLNCVKIMNIHKSKGLQFPICYFAGFKNKFNFQDLNKRFIFDKKYGLITPFFEEGIGTLFLKELVKRNYYQEEISEKIRLLYVALTRAKEKIIIVLPEFKRENIIHNKIDFNTGLKYRSFYDILNSISLNLSKYIIPINLEEINLTKDYLNIKFRDSNNNRIKNDKIEFRNLNIISNKLDNRHASKAIKEIIDINMAKTLEYGTKMHEDLELTNFKDESIHNKYIDNLRSIFNFKDADIYQELEFVYTKDNGEYHGIIDLMLEYDKEIKIIDYKLKNILDEEYEKQLNVYYNYIKLVSNKDIHLYLYSIMDNNVKEVKIKEIVNN